MADESELAEVAGPEDVKEAPKGDEGQQEKEPAAEVEEKEGDAPKEGEKPEVSEAEEKKRESARERRERDKALKQRLRDEAKAAEKRATEAEARAQRILDAGKSEEAPKEADFTDYTEYVAARAVWLSSAKSAERDAKFASEEADAARREAEEKAKEELRIAYEAFEAGKEEARSRYRNYDQVVGQHGLFPVGSHLPELVLQSDMAPDLAYVIASDKATHDRLLSLPPVEAAREIGRMEAALAAPKPRTQTKAPDPIAPVSGSSQPSKDPARMTPEEYAKWREGGGTFNLR